MDDGESIAQKGGAAMRKRYSSPQLVHRGSLNKVAFNFYVEVLEPKA